MDKPNVFTREQLVKIHHVFNDVCNGLESEWIFRSQTIEDGTLRTMIGDVVDDRGAAGRTWSSVWVNLKNMSLPQTEKWIQQKDSIEGVDASDRSADYITTLLFTPHADQLQELSSEVDADKAPDTEAG